MKHQQSLICHISTHQHISHTYSFSSNVPYFYDSPLFYYFQCLTGLNISEIYFEFHAFFVAILSQLASNYFNISFIRFVRLILHHYTSNFSNLLYLMLFAVLLSHVYIQFIMYHFPNLAAENDSFSFTCAATRL